MFNPASPLGFGAIAGSKNAFTGILFASQNDKTIASATEKYQVNWQQLGTGRKMIFSLLGANSETTILSFSVASHVFIQSAWDVFLGGGITTGWEISARSDGLDINASRRIGGTGVKLKQLSDDDSPMDSIRIKAQMISLQDKKARLTVRYDSDTFKVPVYGGDSQKREISFCIGASYGRFSIEADNRTLFDVDRGKIESTRYLLSFEREDIAIQAEFMLNRPDGSPLSADNGKLRIDTSHTSLSISGRKTELDMFWEYKEKEMSFRISINQDRLVTASLKFTGL